MNRHILTACGILGVLALAGPAAAGELSTQVKNNEWTVKSGSTTLCVYRFAPSLPKPYVSVLTTTRGDNLLRDSPFDHKHHHALMYAVAVNGNNFWEEAPGHGVERHAGGISSSGSAVSSGPSSANFRHHVRWLTAADAAGTDPMPPALLEETRTITVTVDEKAKEVALRWRSEFELGTKAPEVTIGGSEYFGLGMRFLQELDPVSSPMIGATRVEGDRLVAPGPFGAMQFDAPGRPATVAVFTSPANAKSPATFFTMRRKPFAYLAATQALDKAPLKYKKGDRFAVEFLVVTYPELKPAGQLEARGKRW